MEKHRQRCETCGNFYGCPVFTGTFRIYLDYFRKEDKAMDDFMIGIERVGCASWLPWSE